MRNSFRLWPVLIAILFVAGSCNYFTYTPRSKKSKQLAKPSIILLSRIADYRTEKKAWPATLHDFAAGGQKYAESLDNFRYTYTSFRIVDSNKMIFYFNNHISDVENFEKTQKIDLNSHSGKVTYQMQKGKVVWKLKMR